MKTIVLNGEPVQTEVNTLAELVDTLNLQGKRFAMEVDGELAPKTSLTSIAITDGMGVEVVVAVGGG